MAAAQVEDRLEELEHAVVQMVSGQMVTALHAAPCLPALKIALPALNTGWCMIVWAAAAVVPMGKATATVDPP